MALSERIIPALSWLKSYSKLDFKGDLNAGLTVGVLVIPQGMAYAMIAGLPPVYGLYASLVPVIIYAIFGTSRQLAVGAAAMDSLFVAATVSVLAVQGTDNYIELAILLAFMMGAIQLLFGILRLGFIVNFLSKPVIVGFTSAAALVIALNQVGYLLGIDLPKSNQVQYLVNDLVKLIGEIHLPSLIFTLIAIVFLVSFKIWFKKFPAALVLLIAGIAATYFLRLDNYGIDIIKEVPSGLPSVDIPTFSKGNVINLLPAAIALALIAFMEAISIAKALEEKSGGKVNANKELIALGSSNLVGSLFSSFSVTGGFSRSAVNSSAGARTPLAGVISSIVILCTLLFLTDLFYFLPKVILAAIILVAVLGLIDIKSAKSWWRTDKKEFLMYAATLVVTATVGIQQGIVVGVVLSMLILVYNVTTPHMAIVGKIPGTNLYRNMERFIDVELDSDVMIVRFDARLFYANADYFREKLLEFEKIKGGNLKAIIVDGSGINSIDSTAIYMIRKLLIAYKRRKIQVLFSGLKGPVRDKFNQNRIYTELGEEFFFVNIEDAEKYLRGEKTSYSSDVARQSNFKLRVRR